MPLISNVIWDEILGNDFNGIKIVCEFSGHQPYLFDVCHRYRFSQPPQCLKFTQGEITTRDCDPSFLCEVSFDSLNTFISYFSVSILEIDVLKE